MVSFPHPRDRPPFYMHDMIRSQPHYVAETVGRLEGPRADDMLGRNRNIVITGCGTSFHSAMYGAEVLQEALGTTKVVRAVHAYDLAHGVGTLRRSTVLGVSHSGSTSTTNLALRRARRGGSRTLGLCGLPGSIMEEETVRTWVIGSTHDRSWANTMIYTTQLAAFAGLAVDAGGASWAGLRR